MEPREEVRPFFVRYDYARARARLLIKEFGLTAPPVDVEAILKARGAVVRRHAIKEIDYAVTFFYRDRYYVSVNVCNPGRDRWSFAHELGHVELGHYLTYDLDTLADDRLTEKERRILDREADVFARDLLMPAKWVRSAAGGPARFETIDELADMFGVSWEAMMIRMDELGLFPKDMAVR
ncbi:MAG: ImmA/IrrE family metallo-endopeptidase [Bacillota bacterium]